MLKKLIIVLYIISSIILLFYVAQPTFDFPNPPSGFIQSTEPADTETPLRRAYFTDLTRQEVLDWYRSQFTKNKIVKFSLPTFLFNYPPEESGSIIRDQTRSTFLQEFVHPFRETLFINGYEPAADDDKNKIVIDGTHYRQKVIVKYVPNNLALRLLVMLITLVSVPVLHISFVPEFIFIKSLMMKDHKKRE